MHLYTHSHYSHIHSIPPSLEPEECTDIVVACHRGCVGTRPSTDIHISTVHYSGGCVVDIKRTSPPSDSLAYEGLRESFSDHPHLRSTSVAVPGEVHVTDGESVRCCCCC